MEGEREDSRAIENCYKLKLKRLFDQRIRDIEHVHKEKHDALEEEYAIKIREAAAAREAAEAARRDAALLAESAKDKSDTASSPKSRARVRPQTGIQRGSLGAGGGRGVRSLGLGKSGSVADQLADRFIEANDCGGGGDLIMEPASPPGSTAARRTGSFASPARSGLNNKAASRPQTSSGVRRI